MGMDSGSQITISAAAAAAYSASHSAHDSNELNPISGDSESRNVFVESPCSKFIGSIEDGSFSFRVCDSFSPCFCVFFQSICVFLSQSICCNVWSSMRLRLSVSLPLARLSASEVASS
jgi:hypothetical protein